MDVDFAGIQFACSQSDECPSGQICVDQLCRAQSTVDGSVVGRGDAAAATSADAGTSPDVDPGLIEVEITGPEHTDDTYLAADAPDQNFGAADTAMSDAEPLKIGLIRFDVSAIPPTAEIVSAELEVYISDPIEAGQFEVFATGEAWSESAATFNSRDTDLLWSASGGINAGESPAIVTAPTTVGLVELEVPVALVESWVRGGDNYGLRWVSVSASGRGGQFASSESPEPTRRPVLTVSYRLSDS